MPRIFHLSPGRRLQFAVSLALMAGAFVLEIVTPRGIADWIIYLAPVAWAAYYVGGGFAQAITIACTVLVVAGYFVSPPGTLPAHLSLVNRVLALGALWIAFAFVARLRAYRNAIGEKEERFREVSENIHEVFWLTDWTRRMNLFVSPAYETIWGRPREEVLRDPLSWFRAIHPEDRERVAASYEHGIRLGIWEDDYRIVRPDGSIRWIRDRGFPIRDETGALVRVAGIAEDITERKRLQDMIASVAKGTTDIGEDFLRALVREIATAFHARHAFIGELLPGQDPPRVRTLAQWSDGRHVDNIEYAVAGTPCAAALEGRACFCPADVQRAYPDDALAAQMEVVSYLGAPLIAGDGRRLGVLAVMDSRPMDTSWDPTPIMELFASRATAELQRLRAEQASRISEERLNLALEASSDGLYDWDIPTGRCYFSPRWFKALGYSPNELPHHVDTWKSLVHPDDMPGIQQALEEHFAGRTPVYEHRNRLRRKNGTWRWNLDRGRVVERDAQGRPLRMIGVDADISARVALEESHRALESKIQQAQRLESLGTLAGGIAHDFNNLLTSILGYADLALLELPPHAVARNYIQEVMKGARHAADLTQQMLAYSGKGKFVVQPVHIPDVVEDMRHLLQVSISKKCVLNIRAEANLPPVEVDVSQLRQVIMNLVINASDAIGDRSGVIALHIGAMECDATYLAETYLNEDLDTGLYVFIEITDTGAGMTEEVRHRIFDPFFTTKAAGRGLGLAAVLGIVRGHRGAIKTYSEPGRGTTFKVLFRASPYAAAALGAPSAAASDWRGSGVVLVADDEESVRALSKAMLASMGFEVLLARDGLEAVEAVRQHQQGIRAVLLDMTMPHMGGADAFREIHRMRPDLPVILSSGYDEQSATSQFVGKGLAAFIQKPYRLQELTATLRKTLGE